MMTAYDDKIQRMISQAEGRDNRLPPAERLVAFESFWMEMGGVCTGRSYFSTVGGRVGIGPPSVATGDLAVVIYGAGPTFILRRSAPLDARMEIVGDAFVHGLMDLKNTTIDDTGPDEWFDIC